MIFESKEKREYKKMLKLREQQSKKEHERSLELLKAKQKIKDKENKSQKINDKSFRKGFRNWIKDKIASKRTVLIEMTHTNGTVSIYYIMGKIHKFNLNGVGYIIDEEMKIYNNTSQSYMYRFHESFVMPYKIDISATEMKKALANQGEDIKEISTSFNPSVLKDILKFEYAKGVIQGAEIHDFIKKTLILGVITLLAVLVHLIVAAYKGGWI